MQCHAQQDSVPSLFPNNPKRNTPWIHTLYLNLMASDGLVVLSSTLSGTLQASFRLVLHSRSTEVLPGPPSTL